MKPTILIISLGNPLRSDDALGAQVIENLKESLPLPFKKYITMETAHQIDIAHSALIKEYQYVIFVDVDAGLQNNITKVKKVESIPGVPAFSSHIGSIPTLLYLTEKIYGFCPECYLTAIKGHDFSLQDRLPIDSERTALEGAKTVLQLVKELLPVV